MNNAKKRVMVVGATGLVGQELMRQLDQREDVAQVRLIASEDSEGELFQVGGTEAQVETLKDDSFDQIDVVILAAPKEVCEQAIKIAHGRTMVVIDVTQPASDNVWSPHRKVAQGDYVIVPDPVTSLLSPIIETLAKHNPFEIIVSTYQSVSGAGRAGLDELWNQTMAVFNQKEVEQEAFEHQISFNCIPQIDLLLDDGTSRMEKRVGEQLLDRIKPVSPSIMITGVRVPSLFGLSASVTARVANFDREAFETQLADIVELHRDPAEIITPLQTIGDNLIHVTRVRTEGDLLSFWCTADNIQTCLVTPAMRILDTI